MMSVRELDIQQLPDGNVAEPWKFLERQKEFPLAKEQPESVLRDVGHFNFQSESPSHFRPGQARRTNFLQESRQVRISELTFGRARSNSAIANPSSPRSSELVVHATSCSNLLSVSAA